MCGWCSTSNRRVRNSKIKVPGYTCTYITCTNTIPASGVVKFSFSPPVSLRPHSPHSCGVGISIISALHPFQKKLFVKNRGFVKACLAEYTRPIPIGINSIIPIHMVKMLFFSQIKIIQCECLEWKKNKLFQEILTAEAQTTTMPPTKIPIRTKLPRSERPKGQTFSSN